MSAEKNIYGKLSDNILCVQLFDHESLGFIIGCMRFEYIHPTELSEYDFRAACEGTGWGCVIDGENCHISGKHHLVDIMANGDVFIDGNLYTIEDQIKRDREKLDKEKHDREKYKNR